MIQIFHSVLFFMFFLFYGPSSIEGQTNIVKVRAVLKTGIIEIYPGHQDLIGKVDNNLVEVYRSIDNNTIIKTILLVQDAILIVSQKGIKNPKGLEAFAKSNALDKSTNVFLFAYNAQEIRSDIPIQPIVKDIEEKKLELEICEKELKFLSELERHDKTQPQEREISLTSKIFRLKKDIEFAQKYLQCLQILKENKIT